MAEVADALHYAHGRGVIHRDIKPANLMLSSEGQMSITDFGLARLLEEPGLTVSGSFLGTPAYMSPEQVEGTRLDSRSDIYSLGVILFEMLTGQRPYESDTLMRLAMMHLLKPVPQIQSANPAVPPAYQTVINRAMAKKPEDRYPTATDLSKAVMAIVRPRPAAPIRPVRRKSAFAGSFRGLLIAAGIVGGLVIIIAFIAFIAFSMDLFPGGNGGDQATPVVEVIPTDDGSAVQEQNIVGEPSPAPTGTSEVVLAADPTATAAPSSLFITYLFDASNSMLESMDGGQTKLEIGRNALAQHWNAIQSQPNLGLRAYGHRFSAADQAQSCQDTELLVQPAQGQLDSLVSSLFDLQAQGFSPLSRAIREVPGDFSTVPDRTNAVILIADSADNCGEDPCRTVRTQAQGGILYPIYIAGIGVEAVDRESLLCMAENSGGGYLDVTDEASLFDALNSFVNELDSQP